MAERGLGSGAGSGYPGTAAELLSLTGPHRSLAMGQTRIMGVLNLTPDSFSDGGAHLDVETAVQHGLGMVESGAAVIDVGAESTRPGAEPVPAKTQLGRLEPVLRALRKQTGVFISVDTSDPDVIDAVAGLGVDMINDVRGLRAPGAIEAAERHKLAVCIGHMQGEPDSMQRAPAYDDVVAEVRAYLANRVADCRNAGIAPERICVDPGFGFGKTRAHNIEMLRAIDRFAVEGRPVVLGVSRKSMFAKLFDDDSAESRLHGSLASAFWAATRNISLVRAHDVRATHHVCRLADLLTGADAA